MIHFNAVDIYQKERRRVIIGLRIRRPVKRFLGIHAGVDRVWTV